MIRMYVGFSLHHVSQLTAIIQMITKMKAKGMMKWAGNTTK